MCRALMPRVRLEGEMNDEPRWEDEERTKEKEERERDRDRDRKRGQRQTDRQTERKRQTDKQRERDRQRKGRKEQQAIHPYSQLSSLTVYHYGVHCYDVFYYDVFYCYDACDDVHCYCVCWKSVNNDMRYVIMTSNSLTSLSFDQSLAAESHHSLHRNYRGRHAFATTSDFLQASSLYSHDI